MRETDRQGQKKKLKLKRETTRTATMMSSGRKRNWGKRGSIRTTNKASNDLNAGK